MDTVVSGKEGKGCLLVLTERASRFNFITKLDAKNQDNIIKALDILEKQYKDKFQYIFQSITVDNGVEFLNMYGLEQSIYSDDRELLFIMLILLLLMKGAVMKILIS